MGKKSDSGVVVMQLPEGWLLKKLSEVCEFIGGSQPSKANFIYDLSNVNPHEYVRLIQIRDYKSSDFIVYIPKKSTSRFCKSNDIMIGRYGPPVFQILKGLEGAYNVALMKAVPDEKLLDKNYLFWFLQNPDIQNYIVGLSERASGQTGINKKALDNYSILIPPLKEQKRIVAILDEAFAGINQAIANTENNLANARELFESYLNSSAFLDAQNAPVFPVSSLLADRKNSIRTGPFGSQLLHSEFVESGIAVLGIDNAVDNTFKWGKPRFISQEKYQQLSRYRVYPNDVIITIMGTCGRCAVIPENIPLTINSKHLCCISLDQDKCTSDYLQFYFLYHPKAQKYLLDKSKGSIMAGLNMAIIKELPVNLPSIATQSSIVSKIRTLLSEINQFEKISYLKLQSLTELKQSLLQKAFSGELTANNVDKWVNPCP